MKKIYNAFFRLLAAPFVLCFMLVAAIAHVLDMFVAFILYGGEFISYLKNDKTTIKDIYKVLKETNSK
jgi:hypothetical protein